MAKYKVVATKRKKKLKMNLGNINIQVNKLKRMRSLPKWSGNHSIGDLMTLMKQLDQLYMQKRWQVRNRNGNVE